MPGIIHAQSIINIGKRSFSVDFSSNENPLNSTDWVLGQTNGIQWGDFQSSGSVAFGKRALDFGDNTAIVTGTFNPNHYAQGTCKVGAKDDSFFPELELRLRSSISTNVCTGYEVMYSCRSTGGYFKVARWAGSFGSFDYISNTLIGDQYKVIDGDIIRAEITTSGATAILVVKLNGTTLITIPDVTKNDSGTFIGSVYTTGNPGIGGNCNSGGAAFLSTYGFYDFQAGDL